MKNNGKEAEKAFERYWVGVGHAERLRDKKDLMGINGGARVADFAKPSDFLVSNKHHRLHFAEVKSTNDPVAFRFKDIRPAQSAAALKEARWGHGDYIFYIYSYVHRKWYLMFCEKYEYFLEQGKRSVKFEELQEWNAIK